MQACGEQVLKDAYGRSPSLIKPMLPTAYAYMYRYLARLSVQGGDMETARKFIRQALASDKSIFYRDIRSLITLLSVSLSPVAKIIVGRSLGESKFSRSEVAQVQGKN
jgi:hypothetical protein